MMLVAEGDNLMHSDLEIDAFNRVPSPAKELLIMPSISHMSIYSNRADLNVAAHHAARLFTKHLAVVEQAAMVLTGAI